MRDFLTSFTKISLFFTKLAVHMLWQHRVFVSYGVVMFLLGAWTAGGFNKQSEQIVETAEYQEEFENESIAEMDQIPVPEIKPARVASNTSNPPKGDYSVDMIVGKGDTFLNMLVEAGATWEEANAVNKALGKAFDPKSMKLGQSFEVSFDEVSKGKQALKSLRMERNESIVTVARESDGNYNAKEEAKQLSSKQVRAGGKVTSSLFKLTEEIGVPNSIVMDAVKAFSYDVDFQRDIQSGNTFEVIYDVMQDEEGNRVKTGNLRYAKLGINGEEKRIYYFDSESEGPGFYKEDGRSIRTALLRTPINGVRVSSGFGLRKHPVLGYSKMHKGVDFAAPKGTPIYAAGSGVIDKVGRYGTYGKYIKIRHNSTYSTAYAHMSNYAKGMTRGKSVKQGQIIGYVGSTGRSTGPHLHYEVLVAGKQQNPMKVKMNPGKQLAGSELAKFKKKKMEVDSLIARLPLESQVASME